MLKKQGYFLLEFILVLFFFVTSANAQYLPDENTLALWHFDRHNESPNTIVDSGPNSYSASGGILVRQGVYGGSILLNNEHLAGNCGNFVRVYPSFPEINDSKPFSIELYFLMFDLWNQPLISEVTDQNSGPSPLISLYGNKIRVDTFKRYEDRNVVDYQFYSTQELETNKWYYIALIYKSPYFSLWINGVEDSKENVGDIGEVLSGDGTLAIGLSKFTGSSCPYFHGLIDEVRISDIERTNFDINPLILSTNITKQQVLDGLEEERQAKIQEEQRNVEEEKRLVELQKAEEKRLKEQRIREARESEQKKSMLVLLVIIILGTSFGYYFRKRAVKKSEEERQRLQRIEEQRKKEKEEEERREEEEEISEIEKAVKDKKIRRRKTLAETKAIFRKYLEEQKKEEMKQELRFSDDRFVCKKCSYKWSSRKKFGQPSICPACRGDFIVKFYDTPEGKKELNQKVEEYF